MIGDIQERATDHLSSIPPPPPSFADHTSHGFPKATHRSQKVSAFKRSRLAADRNPDRHATEPPEVVSSSPGPESATSAQSTTKLAPLRQQGAGEAALAKDTDLQLLLQQVQKENEDKVVGMSAEQRESELQELEGSLDSGLLELLRKRVEKKAALLSDVAKLASSEDERLTLKSVVVTAKSSEGLTEDNPRAIATEQKVSNVRFAPSLPPLGDDDLSPKAIHDKYYPDAPLNPPALDWLQPDFSSTTAALTTSTSPARFDLSGHLLTHAESENISTQAGLHHHGEESTQAGYTIDEVLLLCRSTFIPQRTIMLSLFSKILNNDQPPEMVDMLKEKEVRNLAIGLGVGALGSRERNSGLLREAVGCLVAGLGLTDDVQEVSSSRDEFHREGMDSSRHSSKAGNLLEKLPLEDLTGPLEELLSQPVARSVLSPLTIRQLLVIILALATQSNGLSDQIAKFLPSLLDAFVVQAKWPTAPGEAGIVDAHLRILVLRIFKACTMGSRQAAQKLEQAGGYGSVLRFLAVPPWTWSKSATIEAFETIALAMEVLEKVNRYGMNGSIVTTASEIYLAIGSWVNEMDLIEASQGSPELAVKLRIVSAYFETTRTWLVCATDPHSMVHEHDLVWTQVEGLSWEDEALDFLEKALEWVSEVQPVDQIAATFSAIAVACDSLLAWAKGATINAPRAGEDELKRLRDGLREVGLLFLVEKIAVEVSAKGSLEASQLEWLPAAVDLLSYLELLVKPETPMSPGVAALMDLAIAQITAGKLTGRDFDGILRISYALLQSTSKTDAGYWGARALIILNHLDAGGESEALQLVDDLVDLPWPSESINSINHQHGLYMLRPFFHYRILPGPIRIVGPDQPRSKMLRLSTTLRKPNAIIPAQTVGLPLATDWLFGPLDDLLHPGKSEAFESLPPAWDSTDLQLVRATLVFASLATDSQAAASSLPLPSSALLFNLTKVFMLSNKRSHADITEQDPFLDETVSSELKALMKPLLLPKKSQVTTTIDDASKSYLPPATPFYQYYSDFLTLYESISFSDLTFGQLLLPPLAQRYPIDFRKLLWCEQPSVLRSLRFGFDQIPLERGTLSDYFYPPEQNEELITGYLGALVKGLVRVETSPFLYTLALYHLTVFVWGGDATPAARKNLLAGLRRPGMEELMQRVMKCPRDLSTGGAADLLSCEVDVVEKDRREQLLQTILST